MEKLKNICRNLAALMLAVILVWGCRQPRKDATDAGRKPLIEPDYSGVTVPRNIAPLNFKIMEEGTGFRLTFNSENGSRISLKSDDGIVRIPERSWRKLLAGENAGRISIDIVSENTKGIRTGYSSFDIYVAGDSIDPWLSYRLLYPGYEAYSQISIKQRSTESFRERSLVENQLLSTNCINCHSLCCNDPDKYLIHVRGSVGGTYFVDGNKVTRRDLKASEMKYGAVYPAWHPGGKLLAFSSNSIVQSFHASQEYNIEVIDLASSLVIYDTEKNLMSPVPEDDSIKYMETFPEWSPDGNYLYYCRARQTADTSDFRSIKYDLVRRAFDESSFSFGEAEMVFDAFSAGKSVSFPRISPDGRYLVFTLHNYGNFSIWHKEADLYLKDLETGKTDRMNINSDYAESYHSWSSNSKWMVFSSKRDDGLTARPYFVHFNTDGSTGKPFVLPQKDPGLYTRMIKTFNRPEFVKGRIRTGPRDFERASGKEPEKTGWAGV